MTTRNASTQAVQPVAADTLLVIGAGEGHDIPPDWQEHYRRLVLVEPLPELARSLRRAFGEQPNVEVLETAIVPDVNAGDTVTLYEFNWTQASSRHQPADLLQLFPGLKTERMRRVSAISLEQLIRERDLSAQGEHALVLEAPADEGPIISALIESDAHKYFSRIQVHYPAAGLYHSPTDPEAMLQALKASGFEIEAENQTDPDWPSVSFTRDRWRLAFEEARETIEALKAKLTEQNKARESEGSERAKAQQLAEERGRQLTERQQQLQRAQQELSELKTRQTLLQEELVRAEAQIDLITDLLLKDESL